MSSRQEWPTATLSECCEIVSGSTPRREQPEYWGGDINWATPRDLSSLDRPVLERTEERITRAGLQSCSARMLPKGAVLFSSRAPVGLVAIAGQPMCTNQGFKSLIPGPLLDSGYLYWFLTQAGKSIEYSGNGTTFTEVSKAAMERFRILLPPLAEQRRNADLLDRVDAVRRRREEGRRLMDELLRSVFLEMFGDPRTLDPKEWPLRR
ncbi:MAG: restriction endonuclease subunit S [Gemmatimonadetes bacterium]|nr:restriction endonuclease subunit S [Gemmatimonadota bacterium]